jgi:hypothetical protein
VGSGDYQAAVLHIEMGGSRHTESAIVLDLQFSQRKKLVKSTLEYLKIKKIKP